METKRYRVITSFAAAIDVNVEAANEEEAQMKADELMDKMDDKTFLHYLDPQLAGVEIEEIKDDTQRL